MSPPTRRCSCCAAILLGALNILINKTQLALIGHEKSITIIKLVIIINELKSIHLEVHKEFTAEISLFNTVYWAL